MNAKNILNQDTAIVLYCVTGARSSTAKNYAITSKTCSFSMTKPSLIKSSRWFLVMRQQMNAIAPPISSMVLTWVLCQSL
jgi:hypothetical protein